jgi:hypothetical protein
VEENEASRAQEERPRLGRRRRAGLKRRGGHEGDRRKRVFGVRLSVFGVKRKQEAEDSTAKYAKGREKKRAGQDRQD